jgi:DNA-directed RNA polymerase beta' subunit
MPDEAIAILDALPEDVSKALGFSTTRPSELLLTLQIVPPPSIRPSNFVGDSKVRSENDLTTALQDIVRSNVDLAELWTAVPEKARQGMQGLSEVCSKSQLQELYSAWDKLQIMTSGLVNHTIKKTVATRMGLLAVVNSTNKRKVIDMKTRLTGKKGRLRGNLSGKRVDQSGRTVISPDASHDI